MEALLTAVETAGSIFTSAGATVLTFITGQPLILVGVGVAFFGWVLHSCFNAIRGL